jgi:alpha-maltose-1-phosphate synthase
MKGTYSLGARFAAQGIGTIALHAVRGIHRHGLLQRLLVGSYAPSDIPDNLIRAWGWPSRGLRKLAASDTTRWLGYLESVLYDAWAERRLEPAGFLHVWGNYGLRSLRRARSLGLTTIVERASSHPLFQARLLQEEYARWGVEFRLPGANLRRAVAEIQAADLTLIPSDFVRRSFLAEGYPEERLIQVPFGVDTDRFRPAEGQPEHPFRVLFMGQVGIRKGVPYLLETWRRLGWRDAELWLVGRVEPGFRDLLQQWAGVPGVRLLGNARDPRTSYQQADVFALPSIEEGSALVCYEALACGLPVVTTPNAGSPLRNGEEGLIVPVRDVDALAGSLEQLRANPALRRTMGQAARCQAESLTWHRYGDALAGLYESLAGQRPQSAGAGSVGK